MQQWSFSVQRQLPKDMVATVAYVGSKGTHLSAELQLNQLNPPPTGPDNGIFPHGNPFGPGQPITASGVAESTPASSTGPAISWATSRWGISWLRRNSRHGQIWRQPATPLNPATFPRRIPSHVCAGNGACAVAAEHRRLPVSRAAGDVPANAGSVDGGSVLHL